MARRHAAATDQARDQMYESANGHRPIAAEGSGVTLIHEHFFSFDEMVPASGRTCATSNASTPLALETAAAVKRSRCQDGGRPDGGDARAGRSGAGSGWPANRAELVACTGIYTYDHLPRYLLTGRPTSPGRAVRARHRARDPGHRDEGRRSSSAPPTSPGVTRAVEKVHRAAARASLQHRRTDHGPLAAGLGHGAAPGRALSRGGRRARRRSRSPTPATPTTSTTSSACSPRASTSGWTATGSTCSWPPSDATRPCSSCCAAAMPSGCSLPRLSPAIDHGLDWYPPEAMERSRASGATTDWRITFLFDTVIPALRGGGMTDEQLHTMMVRNPARWLGR